MLRLRRLRACLRYPKISSSRPPTVRGALTGADRGGGALGAPQETLGEGARTGVGGPERGGGAVGGGRQTGVGGEGAQPPPKREPTEGGAAFRGTGAGAELPPEEEEPVFKAIHYQRK